MRASAGDVSGGGARADPAPARVLPPREAQLRPRGAQVGRQGQRHHRARQADVRHHDGDDGLYARPRTPQDHHAHHQRGQEDQRVRRQAGQVGARHSRGVPRVAVEARARRLSQAHTALLQSAQHRQQGQGQRDRRERRADHHRPRQRHVAHHIGQELDDRRGVGGQGLLRGLDQVHEQDRLAHAHRPVEDESAREEAARHTGQTAGRERPGAQGLAEEAHRAHTRAQRLPRLNNQQQIARPTRRQQQQHF